MGLTAAVAKTTGNQHPRVVAGSEDHGQPAPAGGCR